MNYACLYFSATGNTERAVCILRREIEAAGSTLDSVKMQKSMKLPDISGYDGLIIASPVLAFGFPVFVRKILKSLHVRNEKAEKCRSVYILAVDGGDGSPSAAAAAKILRRLGYTVVAVAYASYPDNWVQIMNTPAPERRAVLTASGDESVHRFAGQILSGTAPASTADVNVLFFRRIVTVIFGLVGRRFLGKLYHADENCNACGICARGCPSGTILLPSGSRARPYWKMNCESCNACMNLCPKQAINTSLGKTIILTGIIAGTAVAGIDAYYKILKPIIGFSMQTVPGALLDILGVTGIILLSHVFPSGLIDRFIIRYIRYFPGVRNFLAWTFTRQFRRYKAELPAAR